MPILSKKTTPKILEMLAGHEELPKIQKGYEYHCLSLGQYNLIDIIEHVVEEIGKCKIDLAVWTAADSNLIKAKQFLENGSVESMRWMIDPSFVSCQPKYVQTLTDNFGLNCIRTIPTHAKFIILYNDEFNVIIQTSMNLNQNKRLESFTIIENNELVDFYKNFVNDVFVKLDVKNNFVGQSVDKLKGLFDDSEDNLNAENIISF